VLTAAPEAGTFGSLRYPPAFADLSGANAAAGSPASRGLPDLRIDGYVGTRLAATVQMTADTGRDKQSLALADAEIAGDGSDATAVTVRVTDAYGNHRPGTAGGVALTLAGPATLIAANPFPLAALGGVGGGFIRSRPGTAGRVTLTATHAALRRAQVGLTVTSVRSKTFI
jgi:beta-galactosidase